MTGTARVARARSGADVDGITDAAMERVGGRDWARDGGDWPNRAHSVFIVSQGLHWHVQMMGRGPVLLLAHGTGAATHSWRDLAPLLARHFTVVAPDLPGHGFTDAPPAGRLSLPGMARLLAGLMHSMELHPALAVGHSAGAAILARMALDGAIDPAAIVALNGAFLPFRENNSQFFSGLAKLLFLNPMVPRLFAWQAGDRRSVERLIGNTGSMPDRRGVELYARLLRNPRHVQSALGMMANWDLVPLLRDLHGLRCRLVLVAAEHDRAIPPEQAERVRDRAPRAEIVRIPGLGHLAHEEDPNAVADLITGVAEGCGLLDGQPPAS